MKLCRKVNEKPVGKRKRGNESSRVASDGNVAGNVRVIDIEKSVVGVIGVKGESE